MNEDRLWTLYQQRLPDNYQKFMYLAIVFKVPFNVFLALKDVWFNKDNLYFLLAEHLVHSRWNCKHLNDRFRRYERESDILYEDVILSYSEETGLEFFYTHFTPHKIRLISRRDKGFRYIWSNHIEIPPYKLKVSFKGLPSIEAEGLTLVEFVNEIINLIE